jgi:MoaA/NifB/PqqE/SkfB family radical SAM enzyme
MLREMTDYGLQTVEWTGGGEPLLYSRIKVGILSANVLGLKQGLITNGLLLNTLPEDILSKLTWIRVSMNCLDYVDKITIPKFKGTLGFSYVMNENTTCDTLDSLKRYTSTYLPSYVRIVPNCQATNEVQEENNKAFSNMVEGWGYPFFYQAKHFSTPENCYWGYLKPFVLHNGWVYPCSSVVLNEDSDKSFHSKYQWIRMEDITQLYTSSMLGSNWGCTHCVFRPQNDLVDSLLNPKGMEDFL